MEVFWILLYIVLVIVAGVVASNKNRSVIRWVLIAALLTPLTLLILLALKPADG